MQTSYEMTIHVNIWIAKCTPSRKLLFSKGSVMNYHAYILEIYI